MFSYSYSLAPPAHLLLLITHKDAHLNIAGGYGQTEPKALDGHSDSRMDGRGCVESILDLICNMAGGPITRPPTTIRRKMKQNKLKMNKLTEEEKRAIRREYDYEIVSDFALVLIVLLAAVVVIALVAEFL